MEGKNQEPRREISGGSKKQREKQEQLRKAQAKKQKIGIIGSAVASLTLLGAAAGIIHSTGGNDSEPTLSIPTISTRTSELASYLPELTNRDIISAASHAAADYTRVVGVLIDGPRLEASVSLAPSLPRMTSAEKEKYCAPGLESKCREAAAITQGPEIYFYTDALNKIFPSGTKNTEETRNSRNEYISWAFLHEISHYKGEQSAYEPSDELFNLVIKYAGEKQPGIKDPKYVKDAVKGALVGAKDSTVPGGGFQVFKGLEEAEAENISRYILQNRGGKVYANLDNPNDTYFIEQRKMLDDLLRKLNPDYGNSIKWLAQTREKKGGREEIMKTVGKKFGATDDAALETGFRVLFAIDGGNVQGYNALVAGK